MPDAALGHHRDADRGLDLLDQLGIAHAGHAAELADVRWDALERHHCDGAGLLCDACLVGGDDVHDHPAREHAGEADLGRPGGGFDGGHCSADCTAAVLRLPLPKVRALSARIRPLGGAA